MQTLFIRSIFQLTFARYYLPLYLPDVEKAIYLDDDIIVQGKTLHCDRVNIIQIMGWFSLPEKKNISLLVSGDIKELYESSLKPGHAAAFSDDCDSASAKGIVRGAGAQVRISSIFTASQH